MTAPPVVSKADLERSAEAIRDNQKILESRHTKDDLVSAFGEQGYHENPDGSWTYDVPPERSGEMGEILAPQRRLMAERGEKLMARKAMTTVRRADGKQVKVYAENEELVCRAMGSRPVMRVRGMLRVASARELGLGDSDELYRETGRGDWEPTGKVSCTTPWPWQKG